MTATATSSHLFLISKPNTYHHEDKDTQQPCIILVHLVLLLVKGMETPSCEKSGCWHQQC